MVKTQKKTTNLTALVLWIVIAMMMPPAIVYAQEGEQATADALMKEAENLVRSEKYEAALEKAIQAGEIKGRLLGKDHIDVAESFYLISTIHHALGDYSSAESYGKRAWGIREKALGKDHQKVAKSLLLLGRIALSTARYNDS